MHQVVAKRCMVSGRVQGVYYRASTRSKALEFDLRGYARNLPDGRVEVLAAGESWQVNALIEWLRKGPPAARVDAVQVEDAELSEVPEGFTAG